MFHPAEPFVRRRFFCRGRWPALLALAVLCDGVCQAGKFNKKLSVGDAAPAWQDLVGVDGQKHSLADLRDSAAVVVVFWCNHCPIAQSYEDRLKQLTAAYQERGVAVAAISVSQLPADSFDKMQSRAREREYNFAYLHDPSQEIARRYGATCTPHAFVLDRARRIAYMGAIDDNFRSPAAVETHYLRDALEAVLAGETPEIRESRQTGCGIEYAPTAP